MDAVIICTTTALTIVIAKTQFWTGRAAAGAGLRRYPDAVTVRKSEKV
ncbi:hypothetical protein [Saccharopolyspora sp. ASAGF58]